MKYIIQLLLVTIPLISCDSQKATVTYYDAKFGYSETVVIQEKNKTTIHISGQIGEGADLETQMRNALANLKKQLNKHGTDFSDLIKINTYIVNYKEEDLKTFRRVREDVFGEDIVPTSTFVGVQSLALADWQIEIDAVAVIPL